MDLSWSMITSMALVLSIAGSAHGNEAEAWVPETPPGLAPCTSPIHALTSLPRDLGEEVRYGIEAMHIPLGSADLTISRAGTFAGQPVTEYRAEVRSIGIADALIQVEGHAAALVTDADARPVQAAARYTYQRDARREMLRFGENGRRVDSERVVKGKQVVQSPLFKEPVYDLLTSFYVARRLPPSVRGCVVIYAGQEAYTLWLSPEGVEEFETIFGKRRAERYGVQYASNRNRAVHELSLWIDAQEPRLPLRVEGKNRWRPVATLEHYQKGKKP